MLSQKGGLCILTPKVIAADELSSIMDKVIDSLQEVASNFSKTDVDVDLFIETVISAGKVRQLLSEHIEMSSLEELQMPRIQDSTNSNIRLTAINSFIESTDRLVQALDNNYRDLLISNKNLPAIVFTENPSTSINSYEPISTGDKKADEIGAREFSKCEVVSYYSRRISYALSGGEYTIKNGVYTGTSGNVDLAGSLKAALGCKDT